MCQWLVWHKLQSMNMTLSALILCVSYSCAAWQQTTSGWLFFILSQYRTYQITILYSVTSTKHTLCRVVYCSATHDSVSWLVGCSPVFWPCFVSQQDNGPINRWLCASVVLLVSVLHPHRGHSVRRHTSGTMLPQVCICIMSVWAADTSPDGAKILSCVFEKGKHCLLGNNNAFCAPSSLTRNQFLHLKLILEIASDTVHAYMGWFSVDILWSGEKNKKSTDAIMSCFPGH